MLQVQISSFIQKVCPHNNRAWGLVIVSKVLNLATRWHWRSPSNLAVFWSCLIFIQKTFLVVPLLIVESSKPFVLVSFNSSDYSVTPLARRGSYDLEISNSSFARDNAVFKCMMKQAGTGQLLHTSKGRPRPGQIVQRNELAFYN